jgi:nicotinamidase/pyrazinamidase
MKQNHLLLIIDMQNDFCPGGKLAVAGGNAIVPLINQLATQFDHVVMTQDWHPVDHSSFASQHKGAEAFSQITMPYGPQTLWPDHCIIGSKGAQFHAALDVPNVELIIRKGYRKAIDSYSAFFENDHKTPTGLGGYLKERGFTKLTCVGLAFDYCVRSIWVERQKRHERALLNVELFSHEAEFPRPCACDLAHHRHRRTLSPAPHLLCGPQLQ